MTKPYIFERPEFRFSENPDKHTCTCGIVFDRKRWPGERCALCMNKDGTLRWTQHGYAIPAKRKR